MELVKLSEAYNLTDVEGDRMTTGNVTVENSGVINININTTIKVDNEGADNLWGSANFCKQIDGKVQTQYNFSGEYQAEYVNYCEGLFVAILEQIEK